MGEGLKEKDLNPSILQMNDITTLRGGKRTNMHTF